MAQTNDTTFGVLLISTWFTTLLYTLEVTQARRYFRKYSDHDPLLIRGMVTACSILNTVNLAAEYACVYLYSVTHWGDELYLQHQNWPIPLYATATGLTGLIVQIFLIRRYHHLARRCIVTCLLIILALVSLGGALTVVAKVIIQNDYQSRSNIIIPATVWLSLTCLTDLSIAIALVYQLHTMKSGFKSSEGLVRRISVTAVSSGVITSVSAVLALYLYWAYMTTNLSTLFGFCMASMYHLTMLYNLNQRKRLAVSGPASFGSPSSPLRGEAGSLGLNLSRILKGTIVTGPMPVAPPQAGERSQQCIAGNNEEGHEYTGHGSSGMTGRANMGKTATSATVTSKIRVEPISQHDATDLKKDLDVGVEQSDVDLEGRKSPPGLFKTDSSNAGASAGDCAHQPAYVV